MDDQAAHELLDAAKLNDFTTVVLLLGQQRYRTVINHTPAGRWSSLHQAAYFSRVEAVERLLGFGADISLVSARDGQTALDVAIARGATAVAEILSNPIVLSSLLRRAETDEAAVALWRRIIASPAPWPNVSHLILSKEECSRSYWSHRVLELTQEEATLCRGQGRLCGLLVAAPETLAVLFGQEGRLEQLGGELQGHPDSAKKDSALSAVRHASASSSNGSVASHQAAAAAVDTKFKYALDVLLQCTQAANSNNTAWLTATCPSSGRRFWEASCFSSHPASLSTWCILHFALFAAAEAGLWDEVVLPLLSNFPALAMAQFGRFRGQWGANEMGVLSGVEMQQQQNSRDQCTLLSFLLRQQLQTEQHAAETNLCRRLFLQYQVRLDCSSRTSSDMVSLFRAASLAPDTQLTLTAVSCTWRQIITMACRNDEMEEGQIRSDHDEERKSGRLIHDLAAACPGSINHRPVFEVQHQVPELDGSSSFSCFGPPSAQWKRSVSQPETDGSKSSSVNVCHSDIDCFGRENGAVQVQLFPTAAPVSAAGAQLFVSFPDSMAPKWLSPAFVTNTQVAVPRQLGPKAAAASNWIWVNPNGNANADAELQQADGQEDCALHQLPPLLYALLCGAPVFVVKELCLAGADMQTRHPVTGWPHPVNALEMAVEMARCGRRGSTASLTMIRTHIVLQLALAGKWEDVCALCKDSDKEEALLRHEKSSGQAVAGHKTQIRGHTWRRPTSLKTYSGEGGGGRLVDMQLQDFNKGPRTDQKAWDAEINHGNKNPGMSTLHVDGDTLLHVCVRACMVHPSSSSDDDGAGSERAGSKSQKGALDTPAKVRSAMSAVLACGPNLRAVNGGFLTPYELALNCHAAAVLQTEAPTEALIKAASGSTCGGSGGSGGSGSDVIKSKVEALAEAINVLYDAVCPGMPPLPLPEARKNRHGPAMVVLSKEERDKSKFHSLRVPPTLLHQHPTQTQESSDIKREDLAVPGNRVFTLSGFMSQAECADIVSQSEERGFKSLSDEFPEEYRLNDRLLALSGQLADCLWSRLEPQLNRRDVVRVRPIGFGNEGSWRPIRLNECFKVARYGQGGHFAPHIDGPWVPREDESSIFTCLIYLNDAFEGGETHFLCSKSNGEKGHDSGGGGGVSVSSSRRGGNTVAATVSPRTGTALLFNHDALHLGAEVTSGTKYLLRTEVMFRRIDTQMVPLRAEYRLCEGYLHCHALYSQSVVSAADGDSDAFVHAYLKAIDLQASNQASIGEDWDRLEQMELPYDVYQTVFRLLPPGCLPRLLCVCKDWYDMLLDGQLWAHFYEARWPESVVMESQVSGRRFATRVAGGGSAVSKDWFGIYHQRARLASLASADLATRSLSGAACAELVVFDLGSHTSKAAVLPQDCATPHVTRAESVVAVVPGNHDMHMRRGGPERFTVGAQVWDCYPEHAVKMVDKGRIVDVAHSVDVTELIYFLFLQLGAVPASRPVLLAEPGLGWSADDRRAIVKLLMSVFRVPSVVFENHAVLVMCHTGFASGLVVSVGADCCSCIPVWDGVALKETAVVCNGLVQLSAQQVDEATSSGPSLHKVVAALMAKHVRTVLSRIQDDSMRAALALAIVPSGAFTMDTMFVESFSQLISGMGGEASAFGQPEEQEHEKQEEEREMRLVWNDNRTNDVASGGCIFASLSFIQDSVVSNVSGFPDDISSRVFSRAHECCLMETAEAEYFYRAVIGDQYYWSTALRDRALKFHKARESMAKMSAVRMQGHLKHLGLPEAGNLLQLRDRLFNAWRASKDAVFDDFRLAQLLSPGSTKGGISTEDELEKVYDAEDFEKVLELHSLSTYASDLLAQDALPRGSPGRLASMPSPARFVGASLGALPPAGWACDEEGEIRNGEPRCKEEERGEEEEMEEAAFKHSQSVEPEDVWKMKVVAGGGASIGIAGEGYDVERDEETFKSTAKVWLDSGRTVIDSDISEDGERHYHPGLLKDYIPETLPYDLALRISKDGNMPQLRFNEDGQWHDFVPEGGTGLKAGPWFPFLMLFPGDRLSDHRVNRPR